MSFLFPVTDELDVVWDDVSGLAEIVVETSGLVVDGSVGNGDCSGSVLVTTSQVPLSRKTFDGIY